MRRMKKRGPNVLYDLNDLLFFLTIILSYTVSKMDRFLRHSVNIRRLFSDNCVEPECGVVEIEEFAVFPFVIQSISQSIICSVKTPNNKSFRNNLDIIVLYEDTPFWSHANANQDPLA